MKVATFNVNSLRKRLPVVKRWLKNHAPDVLCLQETKVQDSEFPAKEFAATGYHVRFCGMKGYNGVALFTRREPEWVSYGLSKGSGGDGPRLLHAVVDGVPIVNTYIPQGFRIDHQKYRYKLDWFTRLRRYFARHLSPDEPAIWCGDMNVAPEPVDVHHPEKHLTHVCFHYEVQESLPARCRLGVRGPVPASLPGPATVYVLGLPATRCPQGQSRLARGPYPRDRIIGQALHGRRSRYQAQERKNSVGPYRALGGIFRVGTWRSD